MPGQSRSRDSASGVRHDRGERVPLLANTASSSSTEPGKHDKSGVSGSLSVLGKVWVLCCCGVLPALLFLGVWAAWHHHYSTQVPVKTQAPPYTHPPIPERAWHPQSKPRSPRSSQGLSEHDWADDVVEMPHEKKNPAQRTSTPVFEHRTEEPAKRAQEKQNHRELPVAIHKPTVPEVQPETRVVPAPRRPLLRARPEATAAVEPMVLTARCGLPLELNMICSGIIKAALQTEEARIQNEITKHLPPWVQGVSLSYDGGVLVAEPTVRLTTMPQRSLFGFDPKMRLRCTFESLMRSPKVIGATKLLAEYSGGLCSATTGIAQCTSPGSTGASDCDPVGDVLINDP